MEGDNDNDNGVGLSLKSREVASQRSYRDLEKKEWPKNNIKNSIHIAAKDATETSYKIEYKKQNIASFSF